jgi:hypothetical protein
VEFSFTGLGCCFAVYEPGCSKQDWKTFHTLLLPFAITGLIFLAALVLHHSQCVPEQLQRLFQSSEPLSSKADAGGDIEMTMQPQEHTNPGADADVAATLARGQAKKASTKGRSGKATRGELFEEYKLNCREKIVSGIACGGRLSLHWLGAVHVALNVYQYWLLSSVIRARGNLGAGAMSYYTAANGTLFGIDCTCAGWDSDAKTLGDTSDGWWYRGVKTPGGDSYERPSLPRGCGDVTPLCAAEDIRNYGFDWDLIFILFVAKLVLNLLHFSQKERFPGCELADSFCLLQHGKLFNKEALTKETPPRSRVESMNGSDLCGVIFITLYSSVTTLSEFFIVLSQVTTDQGFVTDCTKWAGAAKLVAMCYLGALKEIQNLFYALGALSLTCCCKGTEKWKWLAKRLFG